MTDPSQETPQPEKPGFSEKPGFCESNATGQSGDLAPTNPTPTSVVAEVAQTSDEVAAVLPWLGHVTMLRRWRHGGLGEVCLGRDEHFHRDVAFKRIKADRVNDPEARRRFELEAEITAKLEHPGIVPIYGMVQGPDGQPCYVMRFIHGETLKAAIQKWHQNVPPHHDEPPGLSRRSAGGAGGDKPRRSLDFSGLEFRALLQKFITVCETMAFAHSKGIIHRDLKPDNVMLGKYGETLVVDWGLAKPFGRTEIERSTGEASLTLPSPSGRGAWGEGTQMGHAAGTPAYMSPEQATGRWNIVGPASDIYSLGAILYEMLTGQRPVQGQDAYEVVAKVQRGEFPRPRQRRPDIPKPLEAICLKAMALKPGERFATAKELSGDVEHWLADEAVAAYREPWTVRAGRWLRRHRVVVSSGVVAMALGVAGLTGITVLVERHAAAVEAQRNELAAKNEALEQARQRGQKLADLGQRIIEAMTDEKAIATLRTVKELTNTQKGWLEDAVKYYVELTAQTGTDRPARTRQALGYFRIGYMEAELGEKLAAEQGFRRASEIYERLADDFPDLEYRVFLAASYNNLGNVLTGLGQWLAAEQAYRQALQVWLKLVIDYPIVPQMRSQMGMSDHNVGSVLHMLGRRSAAEQAYRRALQVHEKLVADFPTVPMFRQYLAWIHNSLGLLLADMGRQPAAEVVCRRALDIREKLATQYPTVPSYSQQCAVSQNNLGYMLRDLGRRPVAEEAFRRALDIQEKLVGDFPSVPDYRQEMGRTYDNLALLLIDLGRRAEAEHALRRALEIKEKLTTDFPAELNYRGQLAETYKNLGTLFREQRKGEASVEWFAKAIAILEPLLKQEPRLIMYRRFLRDAHWGRAEALDRLGRDTEADNDRDRDRALAADGLSEDEPGIRTRRARSLARAGDHAKAVAEANALAETKDVTGNTLYDLACVCALASAAAKGDAKFQDQYATRAVELLRQAVAKGYKDIDHLKKDDDLKALREREDFQKLVKELEVKK